MTGNVALDVSIGLVFIYLLYSLYATVLMELISASFGLRAKNLDYALKRMLMDEKTYTSKIKERRARLWTNVIQIWGRASNLTNPYLYKAFFSQPTIKYLNSGGIGQRPSYLSPEMFVKAIIDTIKKDDPEIGVLAAVEQGLEDKRIELSKRSLHSETLDHIESLLRDANGDLVKFKILLEEWYNETMSRASGWFKRTVQIVLFMVGFLIAVSFNVDTVSIVKGLSQDPDAREQLVNMASQYLEQNPTIVQRANGQTDTVSHPSPADTKFLEKVRGELFHDINKSQELLSAGWKINGFLPFTTSAAPKNSLSMGMIEVPVDTGLNDIVFVTVHESVDVELLNRMNKKVTKTRTAANEIIDVIGISPVWYKIRYVMRHPGGYFLTILALSLGAPFWFDLLNKLIQIRSSKAIARGADAGSTENSTASTNKQILNRAG